MTCHTIVFHLITKTIPIYITVGGLVKKRVDTNKTINLRFSRQRPISTSSIRSKMAYVHCNQFIEKILQDIEQYNCTLYCKKGDSKFPYENTHYACIPVPLSEINEIILQAFQLQTSRKVLSEYSKILVEKLANFFHKLNWVHNETLYVKHYDSEEYNCGIISCLFSMDPNSEFDYSLIIELLAHCSQRYVNYAYMRRIKTKRDFYEIVKFMANSKTIYKSSHESWPFHGWSHDDY